MDWNKNLRQQRVTLVPDILCDQDPVRRTVGQWGNGLFFTLSLCLRLSLPALSFLIFSPPRSTSHPSFFSFLLQLSLHYLPSILPPPNMTSNKRLEQIKDHITGKPSSTISLKPLSSKQREPKVYSLDITIPHLSTFHPQEVTLATALSTTDTLMMSLLSRKPFN